MFDLIGRGLQHLHCILNLQQLTLQLVQFIFNGVLVHGIDDRCRIRSVLAQLRCLSLRGINLTDACATTYLERVQVAARAFECVDGRVLVRPLLQQCRAQRGQFGGVSVSVLVRPSVAHIDALCGFRQLRDQFVAVGDVLGDEERDQVWQLLCE